MFDSHLIVHSAWRKEACNACPITRERGIRCDTVLKLKILQIMIKTGFKAVVTEKSVYFLTQYSHRCGRFPDSILSEWP